MLFRTILRVLTQPLNILILVVVLGSLFINLWVFSIGVLDNVINQKKHEKNRL